MFKRLLAMMVIAVLLLTVSHAIADTLPTPQQLSEYRALLMEEWAADLDAIEQIEVFYACKVIDKTSADVAFMRIDQLAAEQTIQMFLWGDPTLGQYWNKTERERMAAGLHRATPELCAAIPPADRARARMWVLSLMRSG